MTGLNGRGDFLDVRAEGNGKSRAIALARSCSGRVGEQSLCCSSGLESDVELGRSGRREPQVLVDQVNHEPGLVIV